MSALEQVESTGSYRTWGPAGRSRLRLLSIVDLERLPDPIWQIAGVMPQAGLALLYGQPGIGKSFLALDWALSIATGQDWMDRRVQQGSVVYVYAEGAPGLKRRIAAWQATHCQSNCPLWTLPRPLEVSNGVVRSELLSAIQQAAITPRLLVVDTLARCFGGADENATADMNAFVAGLDAIRDSYPDMTTLVVHHTGKDTSKGDRGSTALRGAADTVMRLGRKANGLVLKCDKQKDAEPFKDILFALAELKLPTGPSSCVVRKLEGVAANANACDPRVAENNGRAVAALIDFGTEGASYSEWRAKSGMHNSTFSDVLKRLSGSGAFVQEGKQYVSAQFSPKSETGPEQIRPDAAKWSGK